MNRLAVIGAGAFGTALANAAAAAGRDTVLWMRDPAQAESLARNRQNARALPGILLNKRVRPTADIAMLRAAEAILLVVPAQAVRGALETLGGALPSGLPLVICAKGIERASGLFLSEVVEASAPGAIPAVLSGPSFAHDLARGLPTAVTLACREGDRAAELAASLSGPSFRLYHTDDVRGAEIGGAAKNVLAIAAGIVSGRRLGESARAALVARGFAELTRFAVAHGGRAETLMGLSGLGDVVMSCATAQSRNFAFGLSLGEGQAPDTAKLAEGAFTAEALLLRARHAGIEMPIAEAVADVLATRRSVDEAVAALMARPLRSEIG